MARSNQDKNDARDDRTSYTSALLTVGAIDKAIASACLKSLFFICSRRKESIVDWRRQELNREFDEQALDAFACQPAEFLEPADVVAQYDVGRWELLAYRCMRYAIVALLMVPVVLLLRNLI